MLDLVHSAGHDTTCGVIASAGTHHHESNFALKVINFAADNNSYRLICNSGNSNGCKMHCKRQFPGPDKALAADECTKAVTEAYAGGLGGVACFPMDSAVTRREDGKIPLSKLLVGDEILVSSDGTLAYSPVVGFLHYDEVIRAEFLSIVFGAGHLAIHRDHLIPVTRGAGTGRRFMRASEVRAGDWINSVWIDGSLSLCEVTGVEDVVKTGLCCPVTMAGTIIVDTVECSCYSCPSGLLAFTVGHGLCHASMAPLRLHYEMFTSSKKHSLPRSKGVHPYAKLLMSVATGVSFA